jgi:DNA-binding response OmpR family regulator
LILVAQQSNARVLIADDDPVIRRLLQVNFRLEGFDVEVARHGKECMEMALANPPDAVVLDVQMPRMNGWETTLAMRQEDELSGVPVVLLTARGSEADVRRGEALGVVAHLTKPFDPGELVSVVRRALAGAPA